MKINDKDPKIYDISFIPESNTPCKIEIEFTDGADNFIYGDAFEINVRPADFIIIPFPINPVQINQKCTFRGIT